MKQGHGGGNIVSAPTSAKHPPPPPSYQHPPQHLHYNQPPPTSTATRAPPHHPHQLYNTPHHRTSTGTSSSSSSGSSSSSTSTDSGTGSSSSSGSAGSDSEGSSWGDFGVGNLVIDLDAHINSSSQSGSTAAPGAPPCGVSSAPTTNTTTTSSYTTSASGSSVLTSAKHHLPGVAAGLSVAPLGAPTAGDYSTMATDGNLKMRFKRTKNAAASSGAKSSSAAASASSSSSSDSVVNTVISASSIVTKGTEIIRPSPHEGSKTRTKGGGSVSSNDHSRSKRSTSNKKAKSHKAGSSGSSNTSNTSVSVVTNTTTTTTSIAMATANSNKGDEVGRSAATNHMSAKSAAANHNAAKPCDPYEFNAKLEDSFSFPTKKPKLDRTDSSNSPTSQPASSTSTATSTNTTNTTTTHTTPPPTNNNNHSITTPHNNTTTATTTITTTATTTHTTAPRTTQHHTTTSSTTTPTTSSSSSTATCTTIATQPSTITTATTPPKDSCSVGVNCGSGGGDGGGGGSSVVVVVDSPTMPAAPCLPGTHIQLNGVVWHEAENGMLVVDMKWRGRSFVGTLLDNTQHAWASLRWNEDGSGTEMDGRRRIRRPRRGDNVCYSEKRGRQTRSFNTPTKAGDTGKRKRRNNDADAIDESTVKKQKPVGRTTCTSLAAAASCPTISLEEAGYHMCPEPNCNKKYRQISGLKYHKMHAHPQPTSETNNNTAETKDQHDKKLDAAGSSSDNSSSQKSPTDCNARKVKQESAEDVKVDIKQECTASVSDTGAPSSVACSSVVSSGVLVSSSATCSTSASVVTRNGGVSAASATSVVASSAATSCNKVATTSSTVHQLSPSNVSNNSNGFVPPEVLLPQQGLSAPESQVLNARSVHVSNTPPSFAKSSKGEDSAQAQHVVNKNGEVIEMTMGKMTYQISGPGVGSSLSQSGGHGSGGGTNVPHVANTGTRVATGTTVSIPVAMASGPGALMPVNEGKSRSKYDKTDKKHSKGSTPVKASLATVPAKCSTGIGPAGAMLKPIQPKPTLINDTNSSISGPPPAANDKRSSSNSGSRKRPRDHDKEVVTSSVVTASNGQQYLLQASAASGSEVVKSTHPLGGKSVPSSASSSGGQHGSVFHGMQLVSHNQVSQLMNQELSKLSPSGSGSNSSSIKSEALPALQPPSVVTAPTSVIRSASASKPSTMPLGENHSVLDKARQHAKQPSNVPSTVPYSLSSVPSSVPQAKTPDSRSVDNPSPAYSDISDANETPSVSDVAPVTPAKEGMVNSQLSQSSLDSLKKLYPTTHPYMISLQQQQQQQEQLHREAQKQGMRDAHPRKYMKKPEESGGELSELIRTPNDDLERLRRQQEMYMQYIQTYGIPVDPNTHTQLLASDPNYRLQYEKLIAEQEQQQQQQQLISNGHQRRNSADVKSTVSPPGSQRPSSSGASHFRHGDLQRPGTADGVRHADQHHHRASSVDNAYRDKLSETQQIVKENFEVKNQMQQQNMMHRSRQDAPLRPKRNADSPSFKEQHRSQSRDGSTSSKRTTPSPSQKATPKPEAMSPSPVQHLPPGMAGFPPGYPYGIPYGVPYGLPFDPSNPLLRAPMMGFPPGSFVHPGQLRFAMPGIPQTPEKSPKNKEQMKMTEMKPRETPSPSSQHKIYELAEGAKLKPKVKTEGGSLPGAGGVQGGGGRIESPGGVSRDEASPRGYKTPPPQRHLHTHHHTHVVGPPYAPIYDPSFVAGGAHAIPGQTPSASHRPGSPAPVKRPSHR